MTTLKKQKLGLVYKTVDFCVYFLEVLATRGSLFPKFLIEDTMYVEKTQTVWYIVLCAEFI